jgi:hypothetical protein
MDWNTLIYLSTLVLLAAVGAWMHVRLSAIGVRARRLDFDFERLQFARKQHDDVKVRLDQIRTMGNLPSPLMGMGGPLPPRRRGPGEGDMDS